MKTLQQKAIERSKIARRKQQIKESRLAEERRRKEEERRRKESITEYDKNYNKFYEELNKYKNFGNDKQKEYAQKAIDYAKASEHYGFTYDDLTDEYGEVDEEKLELFKNRYSEEDYKKYEENYKALKESGLITDKTVDNYHIARRQKQGSKLKDLQEEYREAEEGPKAGSMGDLFGKAVNSLNSKVEQTFDFLPDFMNPFGNDSIEAFDKRTFPEIHTGQKRKGFVNEQQKLKHLYAMQYNTPEERYKALEEGIWGSGILKSQEQTKSRLDWYLGLDEKTKNSLPYELDLDKLIKEDEADFHKSGIKQSIITSQPKTKFEQTLQESYLEDIIKNADINENGIKLNTDINESLNQIDRQFFNSIKDKNFSDDIVNEYFNDAGNVDMLALKYRGRLADQLKKVDDFTNKDEYKELASAYNAVDYYIEARENLEDLAKHQAIFGKDKVIKFKKSGDEYKKKLSEDVASNLLLPTIASITNYEGFWGSEEKRQQYEKIVNYNKVNEMTGLGLLKLSEIAGGQGLNLNYIAEIYDATKVLFDIADGKLKNINDLVDEEFTEYTNADAIRNMLELINKTDPSLKNLDTRQKLKLIQENNTNFITDHLSPAIGFTVGIFAPGGAVGTSTKGINKIALASKKRIFKKYFNSLQNGNLKDVMQTMSKKRGGKIYENLLNNMDNINVKDIDIVNAKYGLTKFENALSFGTSTAAITLANHHDTISSDDLFSQTMSQMILSYNSAVVGNWLGNRAMTAKLTGKLLGGRTGNTAAINAASQKAEFLGDILYSSIHSPVQTYKEFKDSGQDLASKEFLYAFMGNLIEDIATGASSLSSSRANSQLYKEYKKLFKDDYATYEDIVNSNDFELVRNEELDKLNEQELIRNKEKSNSVLYKGKKVSDSVIKTETDNEGNEINVGYDVKRKRKGVYNSLVGNKDEATLKDLNLNVLTEDTKNTLNEFIQLNPDIPIIPEVDSEHPFYIDKDGLHITTKDVAGKDNSSSLYAFGTNQEKTEALLTHEILGHIGTNDLLKDDMWNKKTNEIRETLQERIKELPENLQSYAEYAFSNNQELLAFIKEKSSQKTEVLNHFINKFKSNKFNDILIPLISKKYKKNKLIQKSLQEIVDAATKQTKKVSSLQLAQVEKQETKKTKKEKDPEKTVKDNKTDTVKEPENTESNKSIEDNKTDNLNLEKDQNENKEEDKIVQDVYKKDNSTTVVTVNKYVDKDGNETILEVLTSFDGKNKKNRTKDIETQSEASDIISMLTGKIDEDDIIPNTFESVLTNDFVFKIDDNNYYTIKENPQGAELIFYDSNAKRIKPSSNTMKQAIEDIELKSITDNKKLEEPDVNGDDDDPDETNKTNNLNKLEDTDNTKEFNNIEKTDTNNETEESNISNMLEISDGIYGKFNKETYDIDFYNHLGEPYKPDVEETEYLHELIEENGLDVILMNSDGLSNEIDNDLFALNPNLINNIMNKDDVISLSRRQAGIISNLEKRYNRIIKSEYGNKIPLLNMDEIVNKLSAGKQSVTGLDLEKEITNRINSIVNNTTLKKVLSETKKAPTIDLENYDVDESTDFLNDTFKNRTNGLAEIMGHNSFNDTVKKYKTNPSAYLKKTIDVLTRKGIEQSTINEFIATQVNYFEQLERQTNVVIGYTDNGIEVTEWIYEKAAGKNLDKYVPKQTGLKQSLELLAQDTFGDKTITRIHEIMGAMKTVAPVAYNEKVETKKGITNKTKPISQLFLENQVYELTENQNKNESIHLSSKLKGNNLIITENLKTIPKRQAFADGMFKFGLFRWMNSYSMGQMIDKNQWIPKFLNTNNLYDYYTGTKDIKEIINDRTNEPDLYQERLEKLEELLPLIKNYFIGSEKKVIKPYNIKFRDKIKYEIKASKNLPVKFDPKTRQPIQQDETAKQQNINKHLEAAKKESLEMFWTAKEDYINMMYDTGMSSRLDKFKEQKGEDGVVEYKVKFSKLQNKYANHVFTNEIRITNEERLASIANLGDGVRITDKELSDRNWARDENGIYEKTTTIPEDLMMKTPIGYLFDSSGNADGESIHVNELSHDSQARLQGKSGQSASFLKQKLYDPDGWLKKDGIYHHGVDTYTLMHNPEYAQVIQNFGKKLGAISSQSTNKIKVPYRPLLKAKDDYRVYVGIDGQPMLKDDLIHVVDKNGEFDKENAAKETEEYISRLSVGEIDDIYIGKKYLTGEKGIMLHSAGKPITKSSKTSIGISGTPYLSRGFEAFQGKKGYKALQNIIQFMTNTADKEMKHVSNFRSFARLLNIKAKELGLDFSDTDVENNGKTLTATEKTYEEAGAFIYKLIEELNDSKKSDLFVNNNISNDDLKRILWKTIDKKENGTETIYRLNKDKIDLLLAIDGFIVESTGMRNYEQSFTLSTIKKSFDRARKSKGTGANLIVRPDKQAKADINRLKNYEISKDPSKKDYIDEVVDVFENEMLDDNGMYISGSTGLSLSQDVIETLGLQIGDKVFLSLVPTDDLHSLVPVVVTGMTIGKGEMTMNNDYLTKVLGRDFDKDSMHILIEDENWGGKFEETHNYLTEYGIANGVYKSSLNDIEDYYNIIRNNVHKGTEEFSFGKHKNEESISARPQFGNMKTIFKSNAGAGRYVQIKQAISALITDFNFEPVDKEKTKWRSKKDLSFLGKKFYKHYLYIDNSRKEIKGTKINKTIADVSKLLNDIVDTYVPMGYDPGEAILKKLIVDENNKPNHKFTLSDFQKAMNNISLYKTNHEGSSFQDLTDDNILPPNGLKFIKKIYNLAAMSDGDVRTPNKTLVKNAREKVKNVVNKYYNINENKYAEIEKRTGFNLSEFREHAEHYLRSLFRVTTRDNSYLIEGYKYSTKNKDQVKSDAVHRMLNTFLKNMIDNDSIKFNSSLLLNSNTQMANTLVYIEKDKTDNQIYVRKRIKATKEIKSEIYLSELITDKGEIDNNFIPAQLITPNVISLLTGESPDYYGAFNNNKKSIAINSIINGLRGELKNEDLTYVAMSLLNSSSQNMIQAKKEYLENQNKVGINVLYKMNSSEKVMIMNKIRRKILKKMEEESGADLSKFDKGFILYDQYFNAKNIKDNPYIQYIGMGETKSGKYAVKNNYKILPIRKMLNLSKSYKLDDKYVQDYKIMLDVFKDSISKNKPTVVHKEVAMSSIKEFTKSAPKTKKLIEDVVNALQQNKDEFGEELTSDPIFDKMIQVDKKEIADEFNELNYLNNELDPITVIGALNNEGMEVKVDNVSLFDKIIDEIAPDEPVQDFNGQSAFNPALIDKVEKRFNFDSKINSSTSLSHLTKDLLDNIKQSNLDPKTKDKSIYEMDEKEITDVQNKVIMPMAKKLFSKYADENDTRAAIDKLEDTFSVKNTVSRIINLRNKGFTQYNKTEYNKAKVEYTMSLMKAIQRQERAFKNSKRKDKWQLRYLNPFKSRIPTEIINDKSTAIESYLPDEVIAYTPKVVNGEIVNTDKTKIVDDIVDRSLRTSIGVRTMPKVVVELLEPLNQINSLKDNVISTMIDYEANNTIDGEALMKASNVIGLNQLNKWWETIDKFINVETEGNNVNIRFHNKELKTNNEDKLLIRDAANEIFKNDIETLGLNRNDVLNAVENLVQFKVLNLRAVNSLKSIEYNINNNKFNDFNSDYGRLYVKVIDNIQEKIKELKAIDVNSVISNTLEINAGDTAALEVVENTLSLIKEAENKYFAQNNKFRKISSTFDSTNKKNKDKKFFAIKENVNSDGLVFKSKIPFHVHLKNIADIYRTIADDFKADELEDILMKETNHQIKLMKIKNISDVNKLKKQVEIVKDLIVTGNQNYFISKIMKDLNIKGYEDIDRNTWTKMSNIERAKYAKTARAMINSLKKRLINKKTGNKAKDYIHFIDEYRENKRNSDINKELFQFISPARLAGLMNKYGLTSTPIKYGIKSYSNSLTHTYNNILGDMAYIANRKYLDYGENNSIAMSVALGELNKVESPELEFSDVLEGKDFNDYNVATGQTVKLEIIDNGEPVFISGRYIGEFDRLTAKKPSDEDKNLSDYDKINYISIFNDRTGETLILPKSSIKKGLLADARINKTEEKNKREMLNELKPEIMDLLNSPSVAVYTKDIIKKQKIENLSFETIEKMFESKATSVLVNISKKIQEAQDNDKDKLKLSRILSKLPNFVSASYYGGGQHLINAGVNTVMGATVLPFNIFLGGKLMQNGVVSAGKFFWRLYTSVPLRNRLGIGAGYLNEGLDKGMFKNLFNTVKQITANKPDDNKEAETFLIKIKAGEGKNELLIEEALGDFTDKDKLALSIKRKLPDKKINKLAEKINDKFFGKEKSAKEDAGMLDLIKFGLKEYQLSRKKTLEKLFVANPEKIDAKESKLKEGIDTVIENFKKQYIIDDLIDKSIEEIIFKNYEPSKHDLAITSYGIETTVNGRTKAEFTQELTDISSLLKYMLSGRGYLYSQEIDSAMAAIGMGKNIINRVQADAALQFGSPKLLTDEFKSSLSYLYKDYSIGNYENPIHFKAPAKRLFFMFQNFFKESIVDQTYGRVERVDTKNALNMIIGDKAYKKHMMEYGIDIGNFYLKTSDSKTLPSQFLYNTIIGGGGFILTHALQLMSDDLKDLLGSIRQIEYSNLDLGIYPVVAKVLSAIVGTTAHLFTILDKNGYLNLKGIERKSKSKMTSKAIEEITPIFGGVGASDISLAGQLLMSYTYGNMLTKNDKGKPFTNIEGSREIFTNRETKPRDGTYNYEYNQAFELENKMLKSYGYWAGLGYIPEAVISYKDTKSKLDKEEGKKSSKKVKLN